MSQSLYTSMSGISAATTLLEVISNNVANINTTAFKSSSVNFSDVYSKTISYGSVASGSTGGTNPVQVGVGTQVSSISKNFSNGSAISTGISTDLMIQGSGFFTVTNGADKFYTRAGDFSWDDNGNLVTSEGYKVLGTDNILSTSSSKDTVNVPTSIISVVKGNPDIANQSAENLNAVDNPLTEGKFTIVTSEGSYSVQLKSATNLSGSIQAMIDDINNQLNLQGAPITASCADGTISFGINSGATISKLSFGSATDTSNFVTQTDIANAKPSATGVYTSKILDYVCNVTDVTSAAEATSVNSVAISDDGSIQATYANGDTLSVMLGADGATYQFVYTTAEGVKISGPGLNVSDDVAVPGNFVIQLATVTNTGGMLSVGNNLYEAGPNCGEIVYTVGDEMGAGAIQSGYLEASNVDLSDELSSMILAQRAIEANSRVFSTSSDVMSTIVNMGR